MRVERKREIPRLLSQYLMCITTFFQEKQTCMAGLLTQVSIFMPMSHDLIV